MSLLTALRRQPQRHDTPPPEPTIVGEGDYQLLDDRLSLPGRDTVVRCFPTLADTMRATVHPNPDHWYASFDVITVKHEHRRSAAIWTIKGPNVTTLLEKMQEEKRQAEEQQRRKNLARWKAEAAAERAKREAEEAAKPKPVNSYLTVAGESLRDPNLCVEVVTRPGYHNRTDHTETAATCKACGESHTVEWDGTGWGPYGRSADWFDKGGVYATPRAQEWAQDHAKNCRAMPPKPGESS